MIHNRVEGVGPDAAIETNSNGGRQSASPYRLDLVPASALLSISKVLKHGEDKYGPGNWERISVKEHVNHALVHLYAHPADDKSDKHLQHAACRLLFAISVEQHGVGEEAAPR